MISNVFFKSVLCCQVSNLHNYHGCHLLLFIPSFVKYIAIYLISSLQEYEESIIHFKANLSVAYHTVAATYSISGDVKNLHYCSHSYKHYASCIDAIVHWDTGKHQRLLLKSRHPCPRYRRLFTNFPENSLPGSYNVNSLHMPGSCGTRDAMPVFINSSLLFHRNTRLSVGHIYSSSSKFPSRCYTNVMDEEAWCCDS